MLGFTTKRLSTCLLAWQQQAHMLAGASRLLRRLLAVTVQGALQEWRTVAQERAHWHRVGGLSFHCTVALHQSAECMAPFGLSMMRALLLLTGSLCYVASSTFSACW